MPLGLLVAAILGMKQVGALDLELRDAIVYEDAGRVRNAVRSGASLTLPVDGEPPLFFALRYPAMFNLLRRLGASVRGTDVYGRTLLHYLASDLAVLIQTEPADPDVFKNYTRGQRTGPIDVFGPWDARQKLAKDLIEHGVKLDTRDYAGRTALHYAVRAYSWKGVAMLLDLGKSRSFGFLGRVDSPLDLEVNSVDEQGETPMITLTNDSWILGRLSHDTIVAGLLFEAGANLSIKDRSGRTAEDWAKFRNRDYFAELIKVQRTAPQGP